MTSPATTCDFIPYTLVQERQSTEPIIIGIIISYTLFGVGLLQFFLCYSKRRKGTGLDTLIFWFLNSLLFMDVLDSLGKAVFITQYLRSVIVLGLPGSLTLPRVTILVIATEGVITCMNHACYMYRIIKLTPNRGFMIWTVLILSAAISLGQLAGAIADMFYIPKPLPDWVPDGLIPWASLWLGGAAAADALLCIAFVACLAQHAHKSEFESTRAVILKWCMLTIETGILPSVLQIVTLVVFLVFPNRPYDVSFSMFQTKVYVNSMLIVIYHMMVARSGGKSPVTTSSNAGQVGSINGANGYLQKHRGSGNNKSGLPHHLPMKDMYGQGTQGIVVTSEVHRMEESVELPYYGSQDPESQRYSPHEGKGRGVYGGPF